MFGLGAVPGAITLAVAAKGIFAFPRPPESSWLLVTTGYGFPSGHAIAATVARGCLAYALEWGTARRRYALAGLLGLLGLLERIRLEN